MDEILRLIRKEEERQRRSLTLIPSENYASKAVRTAVGSVLMHKYSEGYPGKRYYQGNKVVDEIENLAIEKAKKLFGVSYANVQPYSGSSANMAVYFALLNPGDKIMGMRLSSGGHLTHGHPKISFSGRYFQSFQYGVDADGFIDYGYVAKIAKKERPKLIIAGTTSYPRILEWAKFAEIAESVGAYFVADISHIAGLIIGGVHPSPVQFADIVTTTTHKTLRGPRGAIIMVTKKGLDNDPDLPRKIDRSVFPGLQGGPHDNQTAAIGVCLEEAAKAEFRIYAKKVVENAKIMADKLNSLGFRLVTGGTDNHLMVVDLRDKGVLGRIAAETLEEASIIVNFNSVPNDPNPALNPSGIRLGTPAITTRGMGKEEVEQIAIWISEIIEGIRRKNFKIANELGKEVEKLCNKFPLP